MQRLLPGLRHADECVVCGVDLPAGSTAWWDARAKAVTCATCHEAQARPASAPSAPAELDRGQAGASAAREHERRKAAREAGVRAAHPRVGELLLKVSRAPQREVAFRSFRGVRLVIDGRDRSKLLEGLARQVAAVREALNARGYGDVSVQGALCFAAGDLPRFKTLKVGEYLVVDRRRLGKQLDAAGPLAAPAIEAIEGALAVALPRR
jgi:hypothetical protein